MGVDHPRTTTIAAGFVGLHYAMRLTDLLEPLRDSFAL
jgi:hypothetical protein